jgi:PAS domain S-box-containing protein
MNMKRGANGVNPWIVLNTIPHGILLLDDHGEIAYINKATEKLLHIQLDHVLGKSILSVLPEVGGLFAKSLETLNPVSSQGLSSEGTPPTFNVMPLVEDDKILGALGIIEDTPMLNALLKDLESYKTMKNWLDAVIDSCYDGLWICDHKGKVLRINKASERISGVEAEQVIGREMQDLVDEGLYDKSVTLEVLEKKTSVSMIQKIKGKKRALITGTPILDKNGEVTHVVTTGRDLTELDQLRSQLEETQALAQRYISRLSELEMKGIDLSHIVFRSEAMGRILEMALRMTKVNSTVLLLGESGVGKGMIAKLIHKNSDRKEGPFIQVDCAGIPESLVESEIFGYEKGAFTGAKIEGKPGLFELADGGTLFLDEIGELPISSQSKLLRFLEDHEVYRVGGTFPRNINARVIVATNRDLEQMVMNHRFREDLYYRLNVVPISIPPLRERREDIAPLAFYFLKKFNGLHKTTKTLSSEVIDSMCGFTYQGNVRELCNLIERLVVATEDDLINQGDLPSCFRNPASQSRSFGSLSENTSLKEALEICERSLVEKAIRRCGSIRKAARMLQVDHATILRKMRKYGLPLSGSIVHHTPQNQTNL